MVIIINMKGDKEVVLKRIYNNSSDDKIVDILKEVKLLLLLLNINS